VAGEEDELPPEVDVRQLSLLGGGWTAGSLHYLSLSGVASITYYETTGWRGVMETDAGSPLPGRFKSSPGELFSLYHILADVGEFGGGEVLRTHSTNRVAAVGLALVKDRRNRVIVANLSPRDQRVFVEGVDAAATVRMLDESNAEAAMMGRSGVSGGPAASRSPQRELDIGLLPYGVATIDWPQMHTRLIGGGRRPASGSGKGIASHEDSQERMMEVPRDTCQEMYRRMIRIRQFELADRELFRGGQVKGTVHTYVGMEASGLGVCMALRGTDLIVGTHRSHGHNIAKGADTKRMMAEILGKETGYCRGRGGSMHISVFEAGSLGALPIVGSGIPLAVGAALAFQMRREDRVAVPFTGDAGTNTGNWHESVNMAAVWKLPVVFVVENNRYGVSTNIAQACAVEDLSLRAQGYGIPGVRVDGFDVMAVTRRPEAVSHARRAWPTLLVTESYRLDGHYAGEQRCTAVDLKWMGSGNSILFADFERTLLSAESPPGGAGLRETEIKREIMRPCNTLRRAAAGSVNGDGLHLRVNGQWALTDE
jgi:pyruvate dehydrogenase E1 component alpha subunit